MNILNFVKNDMGLRVKLEGDDMFVNCGDIARGMYNRVEIKNNKEYISIRWDKMKKDIGTTGFTNYLAKDNSDETWLHEGDFYKLMMFFRGDNSNTVRFQNWLALEVLPSLRKNNIYAEQDITKKQLATYIEENEALRNIVQNYSIGLAQSKDLEKYLKARFPKTGDAFEQVMEIFVKAGILDKDWHTTEKFKKYNSTEAIIKEVSVTTSLKRTKFVLTNAGLRRFAKNLCIEDGLIIMRSFNI